MRYCLIFCIFLGSVFQSTAQRKNNKNTDIQIVKDSSMNIAYGLLQDSFYNRLYNNGMKYGDYRISITALHGLMALHPKDKGYLDSICILYAQTENFSQCIFTGREVLKSNPENLRVISAMAVAEQQLGRYQESLELYQKEYSKNASLYAGYQIAVLQFSLKKFGEAQATLDRLMMNPNGLKEKMSFSASANTSQPVLYKAAAQNLMGIIYQELKDTEKADEYFKKALATQPDFVLAQNNLENLKKSETKDQDSKPSKENSEKSTKTKKTK